MVFIGVVQQTGWDAEALEGVEGGQPLGLDDRPRAALTDLRPDVVGLSVRNIDDTAWPESASYLPELERVAAMGGRCPDAFGS